MVDRLLGRMAIFTVAAERLLSAVRAFFCVTPEHVVFTPGTFAVLAEPAKIWNEMLQTCFVTTADPFVRADARLKLRFE